MTITKTTLWTAANGLADILETAATDAGYELASCVTPVEPAWDCGRIHVWPVTINTLQAKDCHAVPRPTLAYAFAACIGADPKNEDCDFWNRDNKTQDALSLLWAVYGGLVDSYIKAPLGRGTLCAALGGTPCSEVVFNELNTFESADFVIYGGSITFSLGVAKT